MVGGGGLARYTSLVGSLQQKNGRNTRGDKRKLNLVAVFSLVFSGSRVFMAMEEKSYDYIDIITMIQNCSFVMKPLF
jgi:hypothetical protein